MNIYISNIGTQLKNEELKNLFTPHGDVASAEVAMDAFTDQSRGFGYVDMPNDEQAKVAIAALNNSKVGEQLIAVQEAAPKEVRKGSYKIGNGAVNVYRFRKN